MANHNNFDDAIDTDKGVGTYTWSSSAEYGAPTVYWIRNGQTARVTISGHISIVGTSGYTHMALNTFVWGTDTTPDEHTANSGITPGSTATYDLTQFKTNDISMNRVSA